MMDHATASPPPFAVELGFTRVRRFIDWPKSETSDYGHCANSFVHPETCVLQAKPEKTRISAYRPGQL